MAASALRADSTLSPTLVRKLKVVHKHSKLCFLVYMHKKLRRLQAIEGGMPIEAMVDLTGGLAERWRSALSSLPHRSATFFSSLDVEL